MEKKMKKNVVLVTLFLLLQAVTSLAMDETILTYRESTGPDDEEISYVIASKGSSIQIEADFQDEHHNVVTDAHLNTEKLSISFTKNSTVISIHRQDDRIVIEGERPRSIKIDSEIPWYQSLISLKTFVMSGDKRKTFYALSANFDERLSKGKGVQLLHLVAKRGGRETLSIDGKEEETVRVTVTFNDIRSLFWKAHYWYREIDGTLVQYKEVRGAPGTPETVGVLIEEGSLHE
jgi:hypothetical protein